MAEEGPCRGRCKTCFATLPAASEGAEQDLLLLTARDDGAGRQGAWGAGSSGAGSSTQAPDEGEIEAEVRAA